MGALFKLVLPPKGDALAFGFNRIQGGLAAPGLEPKHEKGLGFDPSNPNPFHKKPKRYKGDALWASP